MATQFKNIENTPFCIEFGFRDNHVNLLKGKVEDLQQKEGEDIISFMKRSPRNIMGDLYQGNGERAENEKYLNLEGINAAFIPAILDTIESL